MRTIFIFTSLAIFLFSSLALAPETLIAPEIKAIYQDLLKQRQKIKPTETITTEQAFDKAFLRDDSLYLIGSTQKEICISKATLTGKIQNRECHTITEFENLTKNIPGTDPVWAPRSAEGSNDFLVTGEGTIIGVNARQNLPLPGISVQGDRFEQYVVYWDKEFAEKDRIKVDFSKIDTSGIPCLDGVKSRVTEGAAGMIASLAGKLLERIYFHDGSIMVEASAGLFEVNLDNGSLAQVTSLEKANHSLDEPNRSVISHKDYLVRNGHLYDLHEFYTPEMDKFLRLYKKKLGGAEEADVLMDVGNEYGFTRSFNIASNEDVVLVSNIGSAVLSDKWPPSKSPYLITTFTKDGKEKGKFVLELPKQEKDPEIERSFLLKDGRVALVDKKNSAIYLFKI